MTNIKDTLKRFDKNLDTIAREMGPVYAGLGLGELLGEGLTRIIVKGGNYTPFLRKRLGDQVVIYSVLTAVGAGIMTIGEICEGADESFTE